MNARSRSVQFRSHALQLVATRSWNQMPASSGLSNALQQQRHLVSSKHGDSDKQESQCRAIR